MKLRSQEMRRLSPEMDPLRIGTGLEEGRSGKGTGDGGKYLWGQPPGKRPSESFGRRSTKRIAEEGGFGARLFL